MHPLLQLKLESSTADALPLDDAAANLLQSQLHNLAGVPLPAHADLCSALHLFVREDKEETEEIRKLNTDHRLPTRILADLATERERSVWRTCYESGLHELLSVELLDALAAQIKSTLDGHVGTGVRQGGCGDAAAAAAAGCAIAGAAANDGAGPGDAASDRLPVVLGGPVGTGGGSGDAAAAAAAAAAANDSASRVDPGVAYAASVRLPVVLEIGAGNGVLAYHLASRLAGVATVVATDDGSSKIQTVCDVGKLSAADALSIYEPVVVVCSWMPSGVDFSQEVRSCSSVQQLILLGETNSNTCKPSIITLGHPWTAHTYHVLLCFPNEKKRMHHHALSDDVMQYNPGGSSWATWGVVPTMGCGRCDMDRTGCERCDYGIYDETPKPYTEQGFERTHLENIMKCKCHVCCFFFCYFFAVIAVCCWVEVYCSSVVLLRLLHPARF